ncbi:MAG: hypothetical protein P1U88_14255 [Thalassobaculaceae bacterium]|nr:hypothetical protein [Thalassobaculaceae bacterium]
MAVDTWNDQQLTFHERAVSATRSAFIACCWMAIVAGPPVVGGVLGWMATRDAQSTRSLTGLLGQLPIDSAIITREEVEAVGLDPRDVRAILTE